MENLINRKNSIMTSSSYNKLKKRISELENDIHSLVGRKGVEEKTITQVKYMVKYDTEDIMFSGNPINVKQFDGIFKRNKL